eukprot:3621346-Rhodomonas_salina.3
MCGTIGREKGYLEGRTVRDLQRKRLVSSASFRSGRRSVRVGGQEDVVLSDVSAVDGQLSLAAPSGRTILVGQSRASRRERLGR